MRKLLFIIPSLDIGGAQKIGLFVANLAAQKGLDIVVLSLKDGNNNISVSKNINLICAKKEWKKGFTNKIFERVRVALFVKKVINFQKPDGIIVFGTMTEVMIALYNSKIPMLSTERGFPNQYPGYIKFLLKRQFKKSQLIGFQTKMARDLYPMIDDKKAFIIPNPIFFNSKTSSTSSEDLLLDVVSIGRLVKEKGYRNLILSFVKIHEEFPDKKLYIYGDGPEKNDLEKLISENSAEEYIFLPGKTNDVSSILKRCKLFVLSSKFEGIPNTLLEAMSNGIPVVATDCYPGGARFLTKDGTVGGVLVERESVNSLYDGMKYILEDEERANLLGNLGQYVNDEFSVKSISEKWNFVIEKFTKSS